MIWDLSIVYNEKKQIVALFIKDNKVKIPKLFKKDIDLYTYILKFCWLTDEKLDDSIYWRFLKLATILETWFNIEKLLDFIDTKEDKFEFIDMVYNLILNKQKQEW